MLIKINAYIRLSAASCDALVVPADATLRVSPSTRTGLLMHLVINDISYSISFGAAQRGADCSDVRI